MNDRDIADKTLAALLSTQLLAAEVYSTFLRLSSEAESDLWKNMLNDELRHVHHVYAFLGSPLLSDARIPFVNVVKIREVCHRSIRLGKDLFLLRLEGALRLECAELDYGLEGAVAKSLNGDEILLGFPGDVSSHMTRLLAAAARYSESPNIGMQMRRLSELLETTLKKTSINPMH